MTSPTADSATSRRFTPLLVALSCTVSAVAAGCSVGCLFYVPYSWWYAIHKYGLTWVSIGAALIGTAVWVFFSWLAAHLSFWSAGPLMRWCRSPQSYDGATPADQGGQS